jgi:hypothetical protein
MRFKRLTLVVIAMLLLLSGPGLSLDFGWTISDSSTDPFSNTGSPVPGLVTLVLWYYCTNTVEGLASAEFDVCSDIGTIPLAFTPRSPWLNAGGPWDLLIAVGGCPTEPLPVGDFLMLDSTGGGLQLYPCPSAQNGLNVSVNCVELQIYPNDYVGYASNGSPAPTNCDYQPCFWIGVEASSWGSVKSLYR